LDHLVATQRHERWRQWGFWSLGVVVLVGSLGLLQVVSHPAPVPVPVASVPAPAPAPQPAPTVKPVQAQTPRATPPPQTPPTPTWEERQVCETVGGSTNLMVWDMQQGKSHAEQLASISQAATATEMAVYTEMLAYVYAHPTLTMAQTKAVWTEICRSRLSATTRQGEAMRRFVRDTMTKYGKWALPRSAQPVAPTVATGPGQDPVADQAFCARLGTYAAAVAVDRDRGVPLYQEIDAAQTYGASAGPEAMQVMQEIVTMVYSNPFLLPSQAAFNWTQTCQSRLAAATHRDGGQ
jgi:hypothetical protein